MTINDLKGGYKVVGTASGPNVAAAPATPAAIGAPSFPAAPNDSLPTVALKTVGNIPSSAVGFGKGVLDFLNPIHAAQQAGDLASGLAENDAAPANAPAAVDVAKEVPGQAYKMLVPQFLQHIFKGDIGQAASAIENDPVGQIAPLVLLARQGAEAAGKGAEFDGMIKDAASPITKPIEGTTGAVASVAKAGTRFLGGQLTGLSPDTLSRIVENPQEFSKQAESQVTRPALADQISSAITERQKSLEETSSDYGGVRTSTAPISVPQDYLANLIKEKTGLTLGEDGKLTTSGSATVRAPSDVSALENKIVKVWQPEFDKGYLTPHEFLNFRTDLANMANFDGLGKSKPLEAAGEVMRGKANSDLRGQVPGLTELDQKFAPQITELKALTRGLVDKDGNLTDAAVNRIANSLGKGKDPQLARLEELSPGIGDKIRILKAVEDLGNSRENKPGTYIRAAALGGGVITLNPYLIVSAIASMPEVAVPLLRGLGYSTKGIGTVLDTLGIKKSAAAVADTAKKAVTAGGIGAPAEQND
jgi:hypothetical protein